MHKIFFVAFFAAISARAFEPTDAYTPRELDGFTVLVHREVLAHTNDCAAADRELKKQLDFLTNALPGKSVAALRGVRIWLEWAAKKNGGAEFHPSREWLVAHDHNPEKTRNVEINNTRNFINWSRDTQPCMVIHEFSHAYHFIVLGRTMRRFVPRSNTRRKRGFTIRSNTSTAEKRRPMR